MVELTCEHLHMWKLGGDEVVKCSCDDIGEKVRQKIKLERLEISLEFEHAPRGMSQNNSLAKFGFTTVCNKGKDLMLDVNLPKKYDSSYSQRHFKLSSNWRA